MDELEQEDVLAVAEAIDRLGVGRVVGGALGELDATRRQEVAYPVLAELAVDVGGVVRGQLEACRLRSVGAGLLDEVGVEHLLPRRGVDVGGTGQHAVEVEETGLDPHRQTEGRELTRAAHVDRIGAWHPPTVTGR